MATPKNSMMHVHWSMSSFVLLVILEFCGKDWRMMHVTVAFWDYVFFIRCASLLAYFLRGSLLAYNTTKNLGA